MNKRTKFLMWIVCSMLIVCFAYYGVKVIYRTPLAESMKDPSTVTFRNESLHGRYLCGEFNAKNGFGAYAGYERFISSWFGFITETGSNDGSDFRLSLSIIAVGKDREFGMTTPSFYDDKTKYFDNVWLYVCENSNLKSNKIKHETLHEICSANALSQDYAKCMLKPSPSLGKNYVTSKYLYKRSCPSIACGQLADYLNAGDEVTIYEVKNGWGKISLSKDAVCVNDVSSVIESVNNKCNSENGIVSGNLFEWVLLSGVNKNKPDNN